ncbi:MAG: FkbM family methyltransferase [Reyranella sp.]|nr:FkbM family methyltransferase [Reyranella sp.]
MMKALAKALLVQSVRALPLRARRVILHDLANNIGDFEAAGNIARTVGMTGFVAEGDAGAIRGALDDDAGLAKYARDGVWSPRESSLFKRLFAERGGTYLDIGANIGLTVIPIAQNPQVACYAFEPEPTNFRFLSENVFLNCRAGNVRLLNFALYDRNATLPFEIAERHSGDHRISLVDVAGELDEQGRKKISIPAKRLDDVLSDFTRPLAAKIDVQGAEPFVFSGGQKTLSQASLLSLEFWPYSMRRMGGDIGALISFLSEHFQEGSISAGDQDEERTWQPIASIARSLHEFAKTDGRDYLDVTVRK